MTSSFDFTTVRLMREIVAMALSRHLTPATASEPEGGYESSIPKSMQKPMPPDSRR